jgi:MFS family permease
MSQQTISMDFWPQVKTFNRSARLFLLAVVINGIIFSTWQLYFNIFLLARGFNKDFLGLANSIPNIAALSIGLLVGVILDRLGRKTGMIVGSILVSLSMMGIIFAQSAGLILVFAFITGTGNLIFMVSQAPFMMAVSDERNRSLLFSLSFGLVTISGVVGNLFAGQLPGIFAKWLHVLPQSAEAYRSVLLTAILLGSMGIIPLIFIQGMEKPVPVAKENRRPVWSFLARPLVWKLILPNFLTGLGAAIVIPYLNVFFVEKFKLTNQWLGVLFSVGALLVGLGSALGPSLVNRLNSKIKTIVLTQTISLVFLLLLGFSNLVWLAAVGFIIRGVMMNMASPLYSAFAMEQIKSEDQGAVNSLLTIAWTVGWAVGPMISGFTQQRYGFSPLFITTFILYSISIISMWMFFRNQETSRYATT